MIFIDWHDDVVLCIIYCVCYYMMILIDYSMANDADVMVIDELMINDDNDMILISND